MLRVVMTDSPVRHVQKLLLPIVEPELVGPDPAEFLGLRLIGRRVDVDQPVMRTVGSNQLSKHTPTLIAGLLDPATIVDSHDRPADAVTPPPILAVVGA